MRPILRTVRALKQRALWFVLACATQSFTTLLLGADTVNLAPTACCDGQFISNNVVGQPVWQNTSGNAFMYFNIPATLTFTSGAPVYLRVVYYDEGYGTVQVQYDSTRGNTTSDFYLRSETHTRSSRVNTRTFVTNYHELRMPALLGRQNGGSDLRLSMQNGGGVPLSVRSVTIQNFPFNDPQFQFVLSKPWGGPYAGPSRDDVDRSTLRGKVMAGYQGWFRTPNDLADGGWNHWVRGGSMDPANFTIDMWPDLTGFAESELFPAGDLKNRSGRPAHLFSSTTRETILRHFRWMRQYGIDGAWLQRFVTRNNSGAYGANEWVLSHVREAAHLEGRIWGIEYDISSLADTEAFEVMTNDWRWLVDVVGIRNDSRYARENGQPVIFIWGLPFPDREISKSTANAIVDWFKNDPVYGGNYVIGGWPWWWRTIPDWNDHFQRYDGALAWMPQDAAGYAADFTQLSAWGIDYFPHVWPGFSWAHLQQLAGESQYTPRGGGLFYWQKIHQALGSGASRLFIGMFDEYDEGTAIMPMTDDPPLPEPNYGRFLSNLDRPTDWWMLLSGEARDMLLGHRPYSPVLPSEIALANRPNAGPEASVDLGATNRLSALQLVSVADGNTTAEIFAGRDCRVNTTPASDRYFYFDVEDSFAFASIGGLDVTIDVEYYDGAGNIPLALHYDGTNGVYTVHPKGIVTRGSGLWRTARFNIADAHFGNRQNNGSDFRIAIAGGATVHLDRVWLWLPDNLPTAPPAIELIPSGAAWKFLDNGSNQDTVWRAVGFNDASWNSGQAQLGYGDGDERTLVSFGPNASLKHVTTYFRHRFVVPEPSQFVTLALGLLRDDGAAVYLNGQEIYRANLAAGAAFNALATADVSGYSEQAFFEKNVDPRLLVAGTNVVAVEVHQRARNNSDVSFDFILAGVTMTNLPRGVFLATPAEGTEFFVPPNISLDAIASAGSTGSIERVEFFSGTNKVAEATQVPYRGTWSNPPLGAHVLSARAIDRSGLMQTSPPINIKVSPFIITTTLVPRGSTWSYLDTGSNQGTAWRATNFNAASWFSGRARLGYSPNGEDGESTTLSYGTNASAKHITYYFRRQFEVADLSVITNLAFRIQRDDGAVVYLNGFEMFRSHMPGGAIVYNTPSSQPAVSGADEQTFFETNLPPTRLVIGTNLLAIEVHQSDGGSSDLGFDLELVATGPPPPLRLNIARDGNAARISWPVAAPGLQLESAFGLEPPNWTLLNITPAFSNNQNSVHVPLPGPQEFYRLRRP